jgi:hypothetical protein
MIYNTPTRDEDGTYIVKVRTDEDKKCLIQLKCVSVKDLGEEVEVHMKNSKKIKVIDDENLSTATERSGEWFKKEMKLDKLKSLYVPSATKNVLTADKISASRVFNPEKESIPFDIIKETKKADVLLEFAGIWFAKKTFGPIWNIIQIRLVPPQQEPEPEPEEPQEPQEPEYPEECVISDEISDDDEE